MAPVWCLIMLQKNPLPVTRIRQVESLHLILIQHAVQAAVMCAPSS
jgi:hypothetical protein